MALNEKRILEKVNSRFVVSIYFQYIFRNLFHFVYFISVSSRSLWAQTSFKKSYRK